MNVSPARPATLIGHSLGAHIALRFGGALPDHVDRIVAIEAVGAPPEIVTLRLHQPIDQQIRNWFQERRHAERTAVLCFTTIEDALARSRLAMEA